MSKATTIEPTIQASSAAVNSARRVWVASKTVATRILARTTPVAILLVAVTSIALSHLLLFFGIDGGSATAASTIASTLVLYLVVRYGRPLGNQPQSSQLPPSPTIPPSQTQQLLDERLSSWTTAAAGVAHEINTPLGAITSNTDLIRRTALKLQTLYKTSEPASREKITYLLSKMVDVANDNLRASNRIDRTVHDLREFARLDRASIGRVDLHATLDRTLSVIRYHLAGRIEVKQQYHPIPPVECYPDRLNQVFLNLLLNASQSIGTKGIIEIETWQQDNGVVVELRDNGRGISAVDLPRIFDAGFSTKQSIPSTGLGLSIVTQIISDHGGHIHVTSSASQGTTVRISLPLQLGQSLDL